MPPKPKPACSLDGRVVLVLGSEGLIGRALATGLTGYGAQVVSADRVLRGFQFRRKGGGPVVRAHIDAGSKTSLERLLARLAEHKLKVDVLVNATYPRSQGSGKPFWKVTLDELGASLEAHAGSCFLATQVLARHMVEQKTAGSIIVFGSIYGVVGPHFSLYKGLKFGNPPDYALTKGGIIQFTRYAASLLAPSGIRVNCISPGGVWDHHPRLFTRRYSRLTPLGRMAQAEDLVGPVAFLASDASRFITGQNLMVDGGWSII